MGATHERCGLNCNPSRYQFAALFCLAWNYFIGPMCSNSGSWGHGELRTAPCSPGRCLDGPQRLPTHTEPPLAARGGALGHPQPCLGPSHEQEIVRAPQDGSRHVGRCSDARGLGARLPTLTVSCHALGRGRQVNTAGLVEEVLHLSLKQGCAGMQHPVWDQDGPPAPQVAVAPRHGRRRLEEAREALWPDPSSRARLGSRSHCSTSSNAATRAECGRQLAAARALRAARLP